MWVYVESERLPHPGDTCCFRSNSARHRTTPRTSLEFLGLELRCSSQCAGTARPTSTFGRTSSCVAFEHIRQMEYPPGLRDLQWPRLSPADCFRVPIR